MADEKQPTKIAAPKSFNKVIISGNVEVTLIQSGNERISYADDNTGNVKVMQYGSELKISSADQGPAKIIVYVKDIYRVQASGDAVVKTEGKLDVKYLQLILKDHAVASINAKTESLYTIIEDHADLKLSGSTNSHSVVMSNTPKLNLDRFAALKTEMSNPTVGATQMALSK
ncbi:hypothetical protein GJU39_20980 [Pedobacter petrophilus]|uniref:Putative auto-transporter adhesin head GIN domain-containing protein n=1 Tax=Pedobacter petrophilus TaxID=1908241 RepID=A0A7K0G425_9SPHI|nr:DUF2807 domain-containing protein [Pedobacter petrophilus]MRX78557.1 hypothetical protein [Pedobacter petrophilus]